MVTSTLEVFDTLLSNLQENAEKIERIIGGTNAGVLAEPEGGNVDAYGFAVQTLPQDPENFFRAKIDGTAPGLVAENVDGPDDGGSVVIPGGVKIQQSFGALTLTKIQFSITTLAWAKGVGISNPFGVAAETYLNYMPHPTEPNARSCTVQSSKQYINPIGQFVREEE